MRMTASSSTVDKTAPESWLSGLEEALGECYAVAGKRKEISKAGSKDAVISPTAIKKLLMILEGGVEAEAFFGAHLLASAKRLSEISGRLRQLNTRTSFVHMSVLDPFLQKLEKCQRLDSEPERQHTAAVRKQERVVVDLTGDDSDYMVSSTSNTSSVDGCSTPTRKRGSAYMCNAAVDTLKEAMKILKEAATEGRTISHTDLTLIQLLRPAAEFMYCSWKACKTRRKTGGIVFKAGLLSDVLAALSELLNTAVSVRRGFVQLTKYILEKRVRVESKKKQTGVSVVDIFDKVVRDINSNSDGFRQSLRSAKKALDSFRNAASIFELKRYCRTFEKDKDVDKLAIHLRKLRQKIASGYIVLNRKVVESTGKFWVVVKKLTDSRNSAVSAIASELIASRDTKVCPKTAAPRRVATMAKASTNGLQPRIKPKTKRVAKILEAPVTGRKRKAVPIDEGKHKAATSGESAKRQRVSLPKLPTTKSPQRKEAAFGSQATATTFVDSASLFGAESDEDSDDDCHVPMSNVSDQYTVAKGSRGRRGRGRGRGRGTGYGRTLTRRLR